MLVFDFFSVRKLCFIYIMQSPTIVISTVGAHFFKDTEVIRPENAKENFTFLVFFVFTL